MTDRWMTLQDVERANPARTAQAVLETATQIRNDR